jgi:hypothetical protein
MISAFKFPTPLLVCTIMNKAPTKISADFQSGEFEDLGLGHS